MNTQFVRVNEDGIRWEGTAYQEGPIQVVTIELIETKEETLHFNQKPDEYRVVGINLRDFQPLKTVKELVISKYMKEFYVSDFLFPNLERIIIEEGAPFYAKGGQSFFEGGEASKFLSSWSI